MYKDLFICTSLNDLDILNFTLSTRSISYPFSRRPSINLICPASAKVWRGFHFACSINLNKNEALAQSKRAIIYSVFFVDLQLLICVQISFLTQQSLTPCIENQINHRTEFHVKVRRKRNQLFEFTFKHLFHSKFKEYSLHDKEFK